MTRLGLLGAAAILSSALAAPAMAQQMIDNTGAYQRGPAYQDSYNRWDDDRRSHRETGFWPGEVAAGVAGAAIGTAGAIASAPFRGNAPAYYNNGDRGWSDSYAQRNGFVCQPGTLFVGEDGRQHICQ